MLAPQKESIFGCSCRLSGFCHGGAPVFLLVLALCCRSTCQFRGNSEKSNHMLSATSHIGLEFLTNFLNMSKLQNRLILLYQNLPLHSVYTFGYFSPSSRFAIIKLYNVCTDLSTTPFPVSILDVQSSISISSVFAKMFIFFRNNRYPLSDFIFSGIPYKLKLLVRNFFCFRGFTNFHGGPFAESIYHY